MADSKEEDRNKEAQAKYWIATELFISRYGLELLRVSITQPGGRFGGGRGGTEDRNKEAQDRQ